MEWLERFTHQLKKGKYRKITSKSELPDDRSFVRFLRKEFEANGDSRRAFLCAEKSRDLGETFANRYLAWYYRNGLGVEADLEMASKCQLEYFLFRWKNHVSVRDMEEWWRGRYFAEHVVAERPFIDLPAMKEAARFLISKGEPLGVFFLEDIVIAEAIGIPLGASKEELETAWMKIGNNPHAKHHLHELDSSKYRDLQVEAAEGGSFFAMKNLKHERYYSANNCEEKTAKGLVAAKKLLDVGYDGILERFTERVKQSPIPDHLFEWHAATKPESETDGAFDLLLQKATGEKDFDACIRVSKWYTEHEGNAQDRARVFLEPFLRMEQDPNRDSAAYRRLMLAFLQMYRGYVPHNDVYDGLEQAFAYACKIACEDLGRSLDAVKYDVKAVKELSDEYDTRLRKNPQDTDMAAVYETFTLWYILLRSAEAAGGDVDAMIGLYDAYKFVGALTARKSPYRTSGYSLSFSGNRSKSVYWVERAIAKNDAVAMEIKGNDWQFFGITEDEGEAWLKKARAHGSTTAGETLRINREMKARTAAFEQNVRDYLQSQTEAAAAVSDAKKRERENLDTIFSVLSMPSVITGPFQQTYTRYNTGAFSAEYRNAYGEAVVIEDRQIGGIGRSAKTDDGYFYW